MVEVINVEINALCTICAANAAMHTLSSSSLVLSLGNFMVLLGLDMLGRILVMAHFSVLCFPDTTCAASLWLLMSNLHHLDCLEGLQQGHKRSGRIICLPKTQNNPYNTQLSSSCGAVRYSMTWFWHCLKSDAYLVPGLFQRLFEDTWSSQHGSTGPSVKSGWRSCCTTAVCQARGFHRHLGCRVVVWEL